MGLKLAVKTRFVVNRKEYHGVGDLPPDVRAVYEKVMELGGAAGGPAPGPTSVIVFNGQSYDSPEAMPPEARRSYEAALASMPKGTTMAPALPHEAPDGAIEPAGGSRWALAAIVAGAGALFVWYLLRGRG